MFLDPRYEVQVGPFDPGHYGERKAEPIPHDRIPKRITYKQSKTPVQPPSDWDPRDITRSAQLPEKGLELEFVYGCEGQSIGPCSCFNRQGHLVYMVAALGVVYDVGTHTQRFFAGHDDDMTCLAIDPTGSKIVSGQMGSKPLLRIWNAVTCELIQGLGYVPDYSKDKQINDMKNLPDVYGPERIAEIQDRRDAYYERMVTTVCWSRCGKFIVAVGADNHSMLAVWEWKRGLQCCEMSAQNGEPPQILSSAWSPVTNKKTGMDMFVTVGGSGHVKFWNFDTKNMCWGSPVSKSRKFKTAPQPKGMHHQMHCVTFNSNGNAFTGAANGHVYMFDANGSGNVVGHFQGHKGPCFSIKYLHGEGLFTGGADGNVRLWQCARDGVTWSRKESFNMTGKGGRNKAKKATPRPHGESMHCCSCISIYIYQYALKLTRLFNIYCRL